MEITALETLRNMLDEESELVSVYYGQDISQEDSERFLEKVRAVCSGCEVEMNSGGQPIYYYLISVE